MLVRSCQAVKKTRPWTESRLESFRDRLVAGALVASTSRAAAGRMERQCTLHSTPVHTRTHSKPWGRAALLKLKARRKCSCSFIGSDARVRDGFVNGFDIPPYAPRRIPRKIYVRLGMIDMTLDGALARSCANDSDPRFGYDSISDAG